MNDKQIIENLTQKLEDATGRISELESALKNSQTCLNTFGLIHGNSTYSDKEKCRKTDMLMDIHMDGIFIANKKLLTASE